MIWRLRLLWRMARGLERGEKHGEAIMDKPMLASMTVWGAIVLGGGKILVAVGSALSGAMSWGDAMPQIAEGLGIILAVIGARRAIGSPS